MGRALGRHRTVLATLTRLSMSVAATLFLAVTALGAQTSSVSRAWLGFGLGLGTGGLVSDRGAAVAEAVYQRSSNQVSLRLAGILNPFGHHADVAGELGVLYGRVRRGSLGDVSLAAGLAFTGFDDCSSVQGSCGLIGVPVVVELTPHLLTVVGIGLQAFANLNAESSYGGGAFLVRLGWLR